MYHAYCAMAMHLKLSTAQTIIELRMVEVYASPVCNNTNAMESLTSDPSISHRLTNCDVIRTITAMYQITPNMFLYLRPAHATTPSDGLHVSDVYLINNDAQLARYDHAHELMPPQMAVQCNAMLLPDANH